MIKRLVLLCFLAFSPGRAGEVSSLTPQYSFLWNNYTQVRAAGDYVIGLADPGVAVLAFDSTFSFAEPQSYVILDGKPLAQKRYGNLLIVHTGNNHLHFLDLSGLPALAYLGQVDLGVSIADFALRGSDIYLACWFDGILRYRLENYNSIRAVDYSMTGVLVTQIDVFNDQLLALDEYNGVMRYDLSGDGFGRLRDYLFTPLRAASFVPCDTTLLLPLVSENILIGQFFDSSAAIIDSISADSPKKILIGDNRLVVLNGQRLCELIDRRDHMRIGLASISGSRPDGDIVRLGGKEYLLLPGEFTGLNLYPLDSPNSHQQVLRRPSPITCLEVIDHRLFTGSVKNPLEVYSCGMDSAPRLEYTIYEQAGPVKAMDRNGDTLFALLPQLDRLVFITRASDPDSFFLDNSVFLDASPISSIRFAGTIRPPGQCLLTVRDSIIDAYGFSQTEPLRLVGEWTFSGPVRAVAWKDSLLLVSTGDGTMSIYDVNADYTLSLASRTVLTTVAEEIVLEDSRAIVFEWDQVTVYDCSDPTYPEFVTSQALSLPVTRAVVDGDRLFGIGPEGVSVFKLGEGAPELLVYGRQGGAMLSVEGDVLATSDGGSIHLYDVSGVAQNGPEPEVLMAPSVLSQNYPNPFNGSTNIVYRLDAPSRVQIIVYNVLGHEVTRLVDNAESAGMHRVEWNGSNSGGQSVASGVYFYRITTDQFVDARKMVLVK